MYNKTDRDLFITVTVTYKWDDGIWRVRFGGILSAGEGKELEGEIRGNTRVKILKIETEDAAVRGKD
ncbi:MAG: hypothetical protein LBM08_03220 [Dysgonamonadaceae bacterium]|nr:hypothetical protein [Dysgonamonadaceae bacterium]